MQNENSTPASTLTELQKAQISDLADGQLVANEFATALALIDTNSQALAHWHSLHLVGDVLRDHALANCAKDADFLNTFRAKLSSEPELIQFKATESVNLPAMQKDVFSSKSAPSNDSFFNWKWVAGLSALAASVMLGLNLIATSAVAPATTGSQLAKTSIPIAVDGQDAVMLRNPQLDALIAAHNQVSGSSALQMPSGFLRSATFNATSFSDK
jgi:sigma-E factor negative regulatory protein RseA